MDHDCLVHLQQQSLKGRISIVLKALIYVKILSNALLPDFSSLIYSMAF